MFLAISNRISLGNNFETEIVMLFNIMILGPLYASDHLSPRDKALLKSAKGAQRFYLQI